MARNLDLGNGCASANVAIGAPGDHPETRQERLKSSSISCNTDALFTLLAPRRLTAVVDVGANPIDGVPPYLPLLHNDLCTVTGFEPQAEALAKLQASGGGRERYLPCVLGDGGTHTLRICRAPGMTSLLAPDPATLSCFHGFPSWGEVVAEAKVNTVRLDDIQDLGPVDFLKMDIQGAELMVLKNGREMLRAATVVQIEVSFIGLYVGQPTYSEVDAEMRAQGFIPHCFVTINRRALAPILVNNDIYEALNQLLEADIVYVNDFRRLDILTEEQLKHMALIAHHCFRSFDLAGRILVELGHREGHDILAPYLQQLAKDASQHGAAPRPEDSRPPEPLLDPGEEEEQMREGFGRTRRALPRPGVPARALRRPRYGDASRPAVLRRVWRPPSRVRPFPDSGSE